MALTVSRRYTGCFVFLLVALLLAGPSWAKSTPAWWLLEKGSRQLVLLGSVHLASPEMYPLPADLMAQFDKADALWVEADLRKAANLAGILPGLLSSQTQPLKPELEKALDQRLRQSGIEPQSLKLLPPWLRVFMLVEKEFARLGYQASHGVDLHFLQKAGSAKPVRELEGIVAQLKMLQELDANKLVRHTLAELDQFETMSGQMMSAWQQGDVARLEKLFLEPFKDSPEFKKRMLDDRNEHMANTLMQKVPANEQHFVVVGALHLIGPGSVIEHLRKNGWELKQSHTHKRQSAALLP